MRWCLLAVVLGACTSREPYPLVSVTVYSADGRMVQPGARVIFHDTDGSILSVRTTGPDGHTADGIPEGGAVTAIYARSPGRSEMTTVFGLRGGEEMVLGPLPEVRLELSEVITVIPPSAVGEDETIFSETACGQGGHLGSGSAMLRAEEPCEVPPTDVLTLATTAGVPTRYAYTFDIPPPPTTVTQPAWRDDFDVTELRMTNWSPDADVNRFDVLVSSERRGGAGYRVGWTENRAREDVLPVRWTRGFAERRAIELQVGERVVRSTYTSVPASITIDLEDDLLPAIELVASEQGGVSLRRSGSRAPIDVLLGRVPVGGCSWGFVSPDREEITLPEMPPELDLGCGARSVLDPTVVFGKAISFSGWDDYVAAWRATARLRPNDPFATQDYAEGVFQSSPFKTLP